MSTEKKASLAPNEINLHKVSTHEDLLVVDQFTPADDPREVLLMGQIGAVLNKYYPDWEWLVEVPPKQGIVIIRNMTCDPRGKMGFAMKIDKMDPQHVWAMRAGGEFLERYRMRRGRFTEEQIAGRKMVLEKPEN